jgi:hypothetical protein
MFVSRLANGATNGAGDPTEELLIELELARGIEPPTCGLQITWQGVAQVLDKAGNPPVLLT